MTANQNKSVFCIKAQSEPSSKPSTSSPSLSSTWPPCPESKMMRNTHIWRKKKNEQWKNRESLHFALRTSHLIAFIRFCRVGKCRRSVVSSVNKTTSSFLNPWYSDLSLIRELFKVINALISHLRTLRASLTQPRSSLLCPR